MTEFELEYVEPSPVELEYVEAQIKPETIGHVIPTYEAQTIYPSSGTVFGSVEVDAIPDPTGEITITENDTYDVRRAGTAHVQVPQGVFPSGTRTITENGTDYDVREFSKVNVAVPAPVMQSKTVTPTEQTQTVTPDSGKDGLSQVTVNPIPSQYIVPTDKVTLTENATGVDIAQYAEADVAVPVPTMPEEYAIGGSLAGKTLTGYHFKSGITSIPVSFLEYCSSLTDVQIPNTVETINNYAFRGDTAMQAIVIPNSVASIGTSCFQNCASLQSVTMSTALTTIGGNAFYDCKNLSSITLPSGVTALPASAFRNCLTLSSVILLGNITSIGDNCFYGSGSVAHYDFRYCTAVPTMSNANGISWMPTGGKIVVPDNLVDAWKGATNWARWANYIVGVTEYDNS